MKRRSLIIGLGGIAAGGSLLTGTSAFTSAEAQRSIQVAIQRDGDNPYLELEERGAGGRSSIVGGNLTFDFPGTREDTPAEGLGADTVYQFEHDSDGDGNPDDPPLFVIGNLGTETVGVWGDQPQEVDEDGNRLPDVKILDVAGETEVLTEDDPAVLAPGEQLDAGLQFDTHDSDFAEELSVPLIIRADESVVS